jgi:dihydrofolate reductase
MRISLVVAVARNGVIGAGNRLPWRLPDDLRRFKSLTLGKPVLMGRRTFESIGRPLPERINIVVSRRGGVLAGCTLVDSVTAALAFAAPAPEVMVIGGAEIYRQCLDRCSTIHLTRVHAHVEGDVYFPELLPEHWQERLIEQHAADERHQYPFSFSELIRVAEPPQKSDPDRKDLTP